MRLLFSLFSLIVFVQSLDLCQYMRLIGREAPECLRREVEDSAEKETSQATEWPEETKVEKEEEDDNDDESDEIESGPHEGMSPLARIITGIEKRERERNGGGLVPWNKNKMHTCYGTYMDCYNEPLCDSGVSCADRVGVRCCLKRNAGVDVTRRGSRCPSPSSLGIRCISRRPVSWCVKDIDCSSSTMKCCDTGCGYNMCIQQYDRGFRSRTYTSPNTYYNRKGDKFHIVQPHFLENQRTKQADEDAAWTHRG